MNLQKLSKKLRHAADVIDGLFVDTDNENPTTARKLLNKRSPYSKKNPHWTQMPGNKKRLIKMVKDAAKKRNASK